MTLHGFIHPAWHAIQNLNVQDYYEKLYSSKVKYLIAANQNNKLWFNNVLDSSLYWSLNVHTIIHVFILQNSLKEIGGIQT